MEKKNTMLLTVIAVATLLVAVVGATFAYFSVQTASDGLTKASVTGKASATGTLTATTKTTALNLALSGVEMDETKKGTIYYGTTAALKDGVAYNTDLTEYDLATFTLSGGETNYNCTYKYNVTFTFTGVSATAFTDNTALADDIKVKFTGAGLAEAKEWKVSDLTIDGGQVLTGTVNLTTANKEQTLKISTSFENTTVEQDDLAGISYQIAVTPATDGAFTCKVAE